MSSQVTRTLERALQLADTITMDDYEVVDFEYVRNGEFNPVKVKFERADEEEFTFLLYTPIELFDGTAYIDDVDGVEHRIYFEVHHPLE